MWKGHDGPENVEHFLLLLPEQVEPRPGWNGPDRDDLRAGPRKIRLLNSQLYNAVSIHLFGAMINIFMQASITIQVYWTTIRQ
jgi:hypothetical protein